MQLSKYRVSELNTVLDRSKLFVFGGMTGEDVDYLNNSVLNNT
jgi:hypothetical protein